MTKPSSPYFAQAKRYAQDVISGKIPAAKWTRLACERQINDLKKEYDPATWPFIFDANKGGRVCKFIEKLPHIKGEWAGGNIKLEPWQCFYLTTLFGWVYKANGMRRFRTSYLEVPRKNAKSTISSGVMLYMASADDEAGAECYSAATSKAQARIVFDAACKMAKKKPSLLSFYGVRVKAHEILVEKTDSNCAAVSAEAGNLDGLNAHFASVDELHAHKSRAVFDVIETACGARRQSLLSVITTAGTDITGVCYELHEYLIKLLDDVFQDESFFGIIYTIDEGDDWADEVAWKKANPNYGVSVKTEYIRNLATKAKRSPASQANFRTKHLDFWERSNSSWMDMTKWRACGGIPTDIENFLGKKCWIGLDLSSKLDVTALILLFNEENKWYPFGRYYLPEDTVEEKQHTTLAHYKAWADQGKFILTPGNIIDLDYIEHDIIALCSRFEVQNVAYDPWQATQLATHLLEKNIPMIEVRAIVSNFSEPMKQLEALVHSKVLLHGDDPVLTWMISNVVAHYDKKDNIYPNKEKPDNKIDGVIALIMALSRAILGEQNNRSVYETRGIVSA